MHPPQNAGGCSHCSNSCSQYVSNLGHSRALGTLSSQLYSLCGIPRLKYVWVEQ